MMAVVERRVRLVQGAGWRFVAALVLVAAFSGCGKKGPPPFSLESALPVLTTYSLDDAFVGSLGALKERAATDPVAAAAYARFAFGGVTAGLSAQNPALSRLVAREGSEPGTVGQFLGSVVTIAKGAPAPLPAVLESLALAWGKGAGDLTAALAYAASDAEAAPAVRALVAWKLADGLRLALAAPESERGRQLQASIPGLPTAMTRDPRETVFPSTLRTLEDLLRRGAGTDKGLADVFARVSKDVAAAMGERAFPIPVSPGAEPRSGTPATGVQGTYVPLLVLSLDAEGLKAGVRPTFGWAAGKVADLSVGAGFPGALAASAVDLAAVTPPVGEAATPAIGKARAVAESLESRAFPATVAPGVLSASRGERGRPALVLAAANLPATVLNGAFELAVAAGVNDLRLLPPGPIGRVMPVFFKDLPAVPGVEAPRGPRVLVALTPSGADLYPPAKSVLPLAGWPEGTQAVADGKKLFKLTVPWVAERGFGGRLAQALGVLQGKVPVAPLVDVVIWAKDVTTTQILDATAETLGAPGAPFGALAAFFPGVACLPGGPCPSSLPVLFSEAALPKAAKPQVVMAEARPSGFCEKNAVQRVVAGRSGAYRACYEAELQRYGNLSGRLEVRFTIEPDGSVSGVSSTTNELNASVEACVLRQVSQLKFPKPDGGVCIIRWPFRFQPGG